jgi:hypothetical protein
MGNTMNVDKMAKHCCIGYCYYLPTGKLHAANNRIPTQQRPR